jgi:uncharacterized protein GlcG (DUF336 family)
MAALTRTMRTPDAAGAEQVLRAAERLALERRYRVVVAVVDPAGNLLALRRTDGAQLASSQVAVDKARTAAIFVRPSRELEEQVSGGRLGALALHGAAALTGGIPLVVDGAVVGAVGTSGEDPDQDEAVSVAGARAPFSTVQVPTLTYQGARLAAEAAGALADRRGVAPVVAAVDAAGQLLYLWRPDRAQVASVAVATDKARTAAIYRRPSRDFEEQAAGGRPSALHLAGAVPLQGGMPVLHHGQVVGAVGVSGAASADEDQELAVAGAGAVAAADGHPTATHLPAAAVRARFETGGLLLDAPRYQLDAGRRVAPGEVEYHERVTDLMRVVQGTATVTVGDDAYQLAEGDVLVVPAGLPHRFVAVSDPFLYLVVKVEA